jgi:paraquat-inducible protein A
MEDAGNAAGVVTAGEAGLVGCIECGRASPLGQTVCGRCGSTLEPPSTASLQAVWAWLIAGIVTYIPANIYPMLITRLLGRETENTIVGGALDLAHHGNYGVAAIVFVASVVIPIGKFVAIAHLALAVRAGGGVRTGARMVMYRVVEFIGRWSMIDVFVVAILAALVQLNAVATIRPGIAAVSFAVSVACTMLAALAFDPRLIWAPAAARNRPA